MIESISIKNFKSVVDLTLNLGQFNVLIGENGCGKSNILEGIALGSAANAGKLDREYFANRGIRYVEPKFMFSAFESENNKEIEIKCRFKKNRYTLNSQITYNEDYKPAQWEDKVRNREIQMISRMLRNRDKQIPEKDDIRTLLGINSDDHNLVDMHLKSIVDSRGLFTNIEYSSFIIFSPEETALRKFDDSSRLHPLGRNGEGLFAYLKEISKEETGISMLNEIKENLKVLDWFDDIQIPENQLSNEFSLQIKDRYINETLEFFDQRSANEGFLYLLFYLTLFISDETPKFFAIDNLESSFNPKLCREITRRLVELAKKHDKQVIVTTHSPAILDGLDITNDDERLFAVRRNIEGYTKVKRISYKTEPQIPLSESWIKGHIGGLPRNF